MLSNIHAQQSVFIVARPYRVLFNVELVVWTKDWSIAESTIGDSFTQNGEVHALPSTC